MKRPNLNEFEVEYPEEKEAYLDYDSYHKELEKYVDYLENKINHTDKEIDKLIETLQKHIKLQNA